MISKFQKRLVGIIIIITLGMIMLPILLNGKKKYYQDNLMAIPLVPKAIDNVRVDSSSQASQLLINQPPEVAGVTVEKHNKGLIEPVVPVPHVTNKSSTTSRTALIPVKTNQPSLHQELTNQTSKLTPNQLTPQPILPMTKKGKSWVVQLGALKNATKVAEIITKLQLSGYQVYTSPLLPVQGQITRIFVGPKASKEQLQSSLSTLSKISGLNGQLYPYNVR